MFKNISFSSLKRFLPKYYLKSLIGKFLNVHQHTDQNKDILIFAEGRSGSTWLLEILYSEPGTKYSDQPPDKISQKRYLAKIDYHYSMIHLKPEEEEILRQYFSKLLDDEIQVNTPWRVFNPDYNFFTNRYLVKITDHLPLIEWFDGNFNCDIVYMVRHPIPTALSRMKRNWKQRSEAFLRNGYFKKEYLTEDQVGFANEISKTGSEFEKFILEWCLKNYIPLNLLKTGNYEYWNIVTYEELNLLPRELIEMLASNLELKNKEGMLRKVGRPSRTTSDGSVQAISQMDKRELVRRWQDKVEDRQKDLANRILKKLGLDSYAAGSTLPNSKLLNFPGKIPDL